VPVEVSMFHKRNPEVQPAYIGCGTAFTKEMDLLPPFPCREDTMGC